MCGSNVEPCGHGCKGWCQRCDMPVVHLKPPRRMDDLRQFFSLTAARNELPLSREGFVKLYSEALQLFLAEGNPHEKPVSFSTWCARFEDFSVHGN